MNKILLIPWIMIVMLVSGCAAQRPSEYALQNIDAAIKMKDWSTAFSYYAAIAEGGSKAEWDLAITKVRENPEILESGLAEFSLPALKEYVLSTKQIGSNMWIRSDALCAISLPEDCLKIRDNLTIAQTWITNISISKAIFAL